MKSTPTDFLSIIRSKGFANVSTSILYSYIKSKKDTKYSSSGAYSSAPKADVYSLKNLSFKIEEILYLYVDFNISEVSFPLFLIDHLVKYININNNYIAAKAGRCGLSRERTYETALFSAAVQGYRNDWEHICKCPR